MLTQSGESFLAQYEALKSRFSDPAQLSIEQRKVMNEWLFGRPKEMLTELRSCRPIFQIPGHGQMSDITFVTTHKDVLEVLDRNRIFSVRKYEEKMRPPRGPFVLGMDDGDQYRKELEILRQVLPQAINAQTLISTIGRIVDHIFDGIAPKGRLDVIQDVAWLVPLRLNIIYFGLPEKDETTLKRWFRDIYKDLFLNLRENTQWTEGADKAVSEINAYLTQVLMSGPGDDTVLGRLMQRKADLGLEGVRRNAFGMTVGVVETCLKAIARTVDQFLRRPEQLREAQTAAKQGDEQTVLDYAFEAMRFNPQNHVLFRWCEQDCMIAEQSDHAMHIPQNSLVFAATLSAMFDPEVFPDPEKFDRTRPKENYLFFGHGLHECLGRYIGPIVLQAVLMRLLKLENLRRAPNDPYQLNPVNVLPDHFLVDYGPADS
jgi:cytochrome P450